MDKYYESFIEVCVLRKNIVGELICLWLVNMLKKIEVLLLFILEGYVMLIMIIVMVYWLFDVDWIVKIVFCIKLLF